MAKKKSAQATARCPKCESKDLMPFEGDYFCLGCNWDSLKTSVARGDLDDAMYNYEEELAKKGDPLNSPELTLVSITASSSREFDGSAA